MGTGARVVLFAGYTVLSVAGLVLLKHALQPALAAVRAGAWFGTSSLLFLVGACAYITSFGLWLAILATTNLSVAYPVAIGLTMAFTAIVAVLFLGEVLSPMRAAGMLLVFAGVCLIAWSR